MATDRRRLLTGWIALVLVGSLAGLAVRPDSPDPRVATVAQAPRATTTTVAPTTTLAPTTTTTAPPPPPTTVPGRWLAAIPVSFQVISGKTSWSSFSGLIQVGDWQLTHSVGDAKFTLTHEFGHLIAWHYGTDAFNGAGPAGFPYSGQLPEEMWADCVAQSFTGTSYPTYPLGPCPSDALAFTTQFLASGPGAPLR